MSKQTVKIFGSRLEWLLIFATVLVVQPAKAEDYPSPTLPLVRGGSKIPLLIKGESKNSPSTLPLIRGGCASARVGYCLSQAENESLVQITGVKANPTDKGVEVILQTTKGQQLKVTNRSAGNSFIADVANAQLRLANGEAFTFRSEKPTADITEIKVTNLDANTIRVTVIGEASVPVVELSDSPEEGLIFEVASAASRAQQPQTQPTPPSQPESETQQTQPSAQQDEPIELVVTGEQDGYRVPDASTATRTDTPVRDIPGSIQVIRVES